jgi:hypothetical protein
VRGAVVVTFVLLPWLTSCLKVDLAEIDPAEIETTLFLIGDAGEPDPREEGAPLDSIAVQAAIAPEKSIILYLGDNVYPAGMPELGRAERADAVRRLDSQITSVPQGARGLFIAGNHDWSDDGPFGLYAVRQQDQLISARSRGKDVRMLPSNGCPGPVSIDAGRLRLVVIDSQWWVHDFIVRDSASNCPTNVGAITRALREQVNAPGEGRIVLVAGHHPLITGGVHGGYCGVTGPFRRFGGNNQDIMSAVNRTMRDSLDAAFAEHPPLVYAAGHDHSLQVLKGSSARYLLVSGAGSYRKTTCAVRLRESYFVMQRRSGFMRVDIMRGKGVLLRVFRYNSRGIGGLGFSRWLEPR